MKPKGPVYEFENFNFCLYFSLAFLNSLASADFSLVQRRAYAQKAISTLKETPRKELEGLYQKVSALKTEKCKSLFETATLNCLKTEVQKNCQAQTGDVKKRCPTLSDIMLVNKMNEKYFVSKEDLEKLSGQVQNYSAAYAKTLRNKYALLTTEFILLSEKNCTGQDEGCLATEADQYCMKNADIKNLPWQGCMAAVLWFIGTN